MNITRAILELRAEYAQSGYNPIDINSGLCDQFANEIAEIGFHNCVAVWGNDLSIEYWSENLWVYCDDGLEHFANIHCFIMYNGKFYDSETPQGCDYPDQLLCYQRNMDLLYCKNEDF